MRTVAYFFGLILLWSCEPTPKKENVGYLNGYWEIAAVEFPNGQKKEYSISTTIDYIKLDSTLGFRKKVQPQLSGSYITSDDAEKFEISENEGVLRMVYGHGLNRWEEELTSLEENTFSVQHTDGKIYHYKRYEPLNLQP